ncbi:MULTISPECIES: hypothetical protein [Aquitalea]|jgi:hypothetical protein|uniref:hypothetical protein n=1 Tax=Aquitalea TaxID=407217 RepID=UPI00135A13EF|nr:MULTISPECIES: hypothetical protein [Aquitalea]
MPLTESPSSQPFIQPAMSTAPNPTLADNLSLQARTLLGNVGLLARQDLQARGIHIPPAICLASDDMGRLQLRGQHPQAKQIHLWLSNSQTLRGLFNEAKTLFELLHTCESSSSRWNDDCFCIGITSAGPLAYFESQLPALPLAAAH